MIGLPSMRYQDKIKQYQQIKFGGYDHRLSCKDGNIYDMRDMTADEYPLLTSRKLRSTLSLGNVSVLGMAVHEGELYMITGDDSSDQLVKLSSGSITTVMALTKTGALRRMASLNDRLFIMPDKVYFKTANDNGGMEASVSTINGYISDGIIYGEYAEGNTIRLNAATEALHEGDAVKFNGSAFGSMNGESAIIREISSDKKELRFYENTFEFTPGSYEEVTVPDKAELTISAKRFVGTASSYSGGVYTVAQTTEIPCTAAGAAALVGKVFTVATNTSGTYTGNSLYTVTSAYFDHDMINAKAERKILCGRASLNSGTITRDVPDMDYICENENRLWGCKGSHIYASKLGDGFNWNCFDGISTDSFAVAVGSDGDFTGLVSYLGYPIFFKEDIIYKVYGEKPSNFQCISSASMGVEAGADRSLAVAGETLFYKSRVGIMAYSGGIPSCISENFGTEAYTNAVGGSDGRKYYVCLTHGNSRRMYVYDTTYRLWHIDDTFDASHMAYCGGFFYAGSGMLKGNAGTAETSLTPFAEFGDFTEDNTSKYSYGCNRKAVSKILIRCEVSALSKLTVEIRYDGGQWQTVKVLTATEKQSFYLPVIPHRCDAYRLRFTGADAQPAGAETHGTGAFTIYSITRELYKGSAIR